MPKPRKSNEQLYEEAERAAVMEAVAETEQEIYDDVLNRDPDDNDGDRSLEEMVEEEGLDEEDAEGEEGDADEAGEEEESEDGEGEEPPQPRHDAADRRHDARVPSSRLREEAERRTAAEGRERDLQSKLDQALGRLEALERGQQRQPQGDTRQPQRQEPPDMFADPEGWAKHQRDTITQEFDEKRINASFEDARDVHGDKFLAAFQDLQKTGNPNTVREIVNSHNPGKALMNWHGRQSLMSEIGNDPASYRQRVRDELLADPEFRQEIVNTLRGEARGNVARQVERGQRETRFVPSLNSATGGTSHRGGTSRDTARTTKSIEQEIADSVWDD